MSTKSIFLICTKCSREIRQLAKDLLRVRTRICPGCGTLIEVSEKI